MRPSLARRNLLIRRTLSAFSSCPSVRWSAEVASRGREDRIGRLHAFEGAATSPPGSLGLVHGTVGAGQQALQVTAVGGLGDAGTDSEGDRRPASAGHAAGQSGQPGRDLGRSLAVGSRNDDDELVPAVATRDIVRPHVLAAGLRQVNKHPVAYAMAVFVVDLLEVI